MAIPKNTQMYLEFLEFLADGRARSIEEIRNHLAVRFNLTEEEKRKMLPNGTKAEFVDRVNWTRSDLSHAGLIERVKRGILSITDEGKRVLASFPKKIDTDFLMQYEEFRIYKRKNKNTDRQQISIPPITDEELSDEEIGPPRIKTVQEWISVLENEMDQQDSFIPILVCYLNRPNCEGHMRDIEKACGIRGLNLRTYRFGKRIVDLLGIPIQERNGGNPLGKERFFNIPFIGTNSDDNRYPWRLRPELVEALLYLDLDGHGEINDEPPSIGEIDLDAELQLVEWDYKQKHVFERAKNGPIKRDYDRLSKIQRIVGDAGEELIYKYEKNRLEKCGRKDLAERVEQVSKKDDGRGYDILSFDENGNEKHIEVKATTRSAKRLQFFITANEIQKYLEDRNAFIYFIFDIKDSPRLHIVDREKFIFEFLTPYQYFVDVDVSDKDTDI